jgi:hypothetical protein
MKLLTVILCLAFLGSAAAQRQPEYLQAFDPAKGLKPAQTNLTNILLQIAGILEETGSVESYIRHIQAEDSRVARMYAAKTGKTGVGRMPAHMTADYVEKFIKNWNTLAPALKLDEFAKEIGRCTREGITGTRLSGTLAVQLCNEHQAKVAMVMRGESNQAAGFEELRQRLNQVLQFGNPNVELNSKDTATRDALSYASVIADRFERMSQRIDSLAKPEKAEVIKRAINGAFLDLLNLAQAELEIGILESALHQL